MARNFVSSNPDDLEFTGAIITALPLSISAWFKSTSTSAAQDVANISDQGNDYWRIALISGNVRAQQLANGNTGFADSGAYSANTWHHALATFTSNSRRDVYLDGAGTSNTTGVPLSTSGVNRTTLGKRHAVSQPFTGDMAEVAYWDVVLTADEAAELAAGYSPLFVRPASLVAYYPLVRGLNDHVGGNDLTATGTTVSEHVPIVMPAPPFIGQNIGVVAATNPKGPLGMPLHGPFGGPI